MPVLSELEPQRLTFWPLDYGCLPDMVRPPDGQTSWGVLPHRENPTTPKWNSFGGALRSYMASLASLPSIVISSAKLKQFGQQWKKNGGSLSRSPPFSSMELTKTLDAAVASSLATMLGGIPIVPGKRDQLWPPGQDCVELAPVTVVGAVRTQTFDVAYRPDGIRIAVDSKTLNDAKSVAKNYQNMINDLATEATTVHLRFPYAVVGFLVAIPEGCIPAGQQAALIQTLERLAARSRPDHAPHLAEGIALVIWDPVTGQINGALPTAQSPITLGAFATQLEKTYVDRYKGSPPHA